MGLDAAFRAAHGGSGFGNVKLLPVTQKKGFALTCRKHLDFFFNTLQQLFALCQCFGTAFNVLGVAAGVGLQPVKVIAIGVDGMLQSRYVGKERIACFLPPEPVQGAVGQDAVKQHGQLLGRFIPVVVAEFEHAVLDDVQRGLLITHLINRAFESAFVHALEEGVELLCGGQGVAKENGRQV